jgi:hypothetical protein
MDGPTYTAFLGHRQLAAGALADVLTVCKQALDGGPSEALLIFEDEGGKQVEFDFAGSLAEVLARELPSKAKPKAGPGRPKLGVVSREVTLLPRHWEWLEAQPNGISAALRRLVEEAIKRAPDEQRARQRRDAAGKFMWGMAGDFPNFEEASRALYAGDSAGLTQLVRKWPRDVRLYVERLLTTSFD